MHPSAARQAPASTGHQLTLAQQALWFLHQLAPDSSAYNVSVAVDLHSSVDAGAMAAAVSRTVSGHSVLDCVFRLAGREVRRYPGEAAGAASPVSWLDVHELPTGDAAARAFAQNLAQRPFRLDRQRPVRASLLRRAGGQDMLLLVAHHIVTDNVSQLLVLREILAWYSALSGGTGPVVPDRGAGLDRAGLERADFDEFARWQRDYLESSGAVRAREYWQRELAGLPDGDGLPTDLPRPSMYQYTGAEVDLDIPAGLVADLGRAASAENTTVFAYLFSVFRLLLYTFSGNPDLVIGYPVTLRSRRRFRESVGLFVNTLPFRGCLDHGGSFGALLRQTRDQLWRGLAHRDYPFALMPRLAAVPRDPGRPGLVSVMFVMTADVPAGPLAAVLVPGGRAEHAGLRVSGVYLPQQLGQCDVTLQVLHRGATARAQLKYNTSLFTEPTARRLAADYTTLLSAAAGGALPPRLRDAGRLLSVPGTGPGPVRNQGV